MCDMEDSGVLSGSGGSPPTVTAAAIADCDDAMPALRQSVLAEVDSSPKPGSPSGGFGSASLSEKHSPCIQDPGSGGEKGHLWLPDSLSNVAEEMATCSPGPASRTSGRLLCHEDTVVSRHNADEALATSLPTCLSSSQSPLTRTERLPASESDILDTCDLSNAGNIHVSTLPLRSGCIHSLTIASTPPQLRLRRSTSLPPVGSDSSHTLAARLTPSSAVGGARGDAGSRTSQTPLSGDSGKENSRTDSTQSSSAAPLPLQRSPHSKEVARTRGGGTSHGGGSEQPPTRQLDSFSSSKPSKSPDDHDPNMPTTGALASSGAEEAQLSPLPSYTLPVTEGTCHQEVIVADDSDIPVAVVAHTKKRKKKKNKKKAAAALEAVAVGEKDSAMSAVMGACATGGTVASSGGSVMLSNAVPVTGSLPPPPPIPMMPGGGGGGGGNPSGIVPGGFFDPGGSQGHGNIGGGSLLYSNFPQPQPQQQHFHHNLNRARGQFMVMAGCTQGGASGDGAGDLAMMGYSINGGPGDTEGGGGNYTSAGTPVCAGGDGGPYGQRRSMIGMPMMTPNYHYHSRHDSSGSAGAYGYYPIGMSDYGRGRAGGMSPGHAQMGHQGMGRNLKEGQRPQQQVQQQQTPYLYPPQSMLMGGGGGAGSSPYQGSTSHIRHDSTHRSDGGSGPQYSLQPQQQYQQQQYYYQSLHHNSKPFFHGGASSTSGADANAMQGGLIIPTAEGSGAAEGGGRGDYAGGSMQYNGEDVMSQVQPQVPPEDILPPPQQPQRNVSFRPPMPTLNSFGMSFHPPNSAALATVAAAAGALNKGSGSNGHVGGDSRGGASGAMMARDSGAALIGEARLLREEVMAADIAADAAPRPLLQFTPEVSPRLCRLIKREVLTYLTPSLACLQRRRSQLEILAGYITAALRHAGRQTGHDYGDISYYIFGSVNMRTLLPDGDNDVTVEVDGLVARESTLTPPPSPSQPVSSASLSDGGGAASDVFTKPIMLPVTTDSSTGSVEGTMQLTTTTDGCPRLVAPAVLSIASGEVLGRVRDYLRSAKTPVFVDSLVMAEVRVLKLAMEGCNYDITIGQFGGVNCVRFLHEMDAVIGDQHVLKRTLLLLKAWCCYEAHILGGQAGYIGSYAATVMLISMLNTVEFLEDLDVGKTDSNGDGDGDGAAVAEAKASATLEPLMSGDSAAEEEVQPLPENLASSSTAPATAETKTSAKKESNADPEGESFLRATTIQTSSNRGDCSHDRTSTEQPGSPPAHPVDCNATATAAAAAAAAAPRRPLSPLTLFARFLKFYAYFDFERYCVTAFGPLPLHKITSTPLDLSYLEVDTAHSTPLSGVAALNRATTDLDFLGLTPEGEAAIGHLLRRRQNPLLTVSGVKHLLDEMNRSRRAERQARHEARQQLGDTDAAHHASVHCSSSTSSPVKLNRPGCAAEDVGLMCPSCNTAVFPVRDMNVLDPLRWSSNMVRGVCRNHLQRIRRAFLEGLRLLDIASQELAGDMAQMDVASVSASASASCTAGAAGASATGRRRATTATTKPAASPTSQLSAFSAASSSSRSWNDSAANGGAGQARVQQGSMNDAPMYGSPVGAMDAGGGGSGGEVQLCPGYPAPHSQCTRREASVLQLLFPRTIDAILKHSHVNCPWSHEGDNAAALAAVPQCQGCTKPSLLCTPAIRCMCQPQLIFHPSSTSGGGSTAAAEVKQLKELQLASGRTASLPTSTAPQRQSPSSIVSPTQSKLYQGSGGRRGNVAAVEQVASELDDAFAGQDTSEAARHDGPLGESMVPVVEQPLARDSVVGGATGSQPPPPSSSPPSASPLQGSLYGPGAVEGMLHPHTHQMYIPGRAGNSGGYVSAYPAAPLSPTTPRETYYAMHAGAAAGGGSGGTGSTGGYSLSSGHHGSRNMGPPSQQHQQHPHQAYVRVGSMLSTTMQGNYNMNNGGATGNSSQRAYATNQTAPMPMEGSGYASYGGHSYAPVMRQQYQQRGEDCIAQHSSGNHGYKGGDRGLQRTNHHSNNRSSDSSAQALLIQRL
ncbi:hypothetical protein LPMP_181410 [Leishmania panamensis]|uniref:PAP/OAS1 substrate-binding-related domain-containing protein n=1 Tax=Leishmania panamensis TaxID=5679 RepID=A0A088RMP6_LEIPA|nr:hypothetical protein LPMP_181410 [Leishmania panamensis]AIN97322.1 hypothetical protein LPMP_181410 [Leishmania panamensis]